MYMYIHTYVRAGLQQKVTDMDTQMGALAKMVAYYTQRKRGKAKKNWQRLAGEPNVYKLVASVGSQW